jgi:adenosylmethionine-8-amino-7-oxononanoate aminotransferase
MTLPDGYLEAVRDVCDRYEVLLIADEVITAFGRTGRWFAVEHDGAVPDVITFGKGIGGGMIPLSGMVASQRIREVVECSPTGFSYGHTYSGNPLGCAVGVAVIDVIEEGGWWRPPRPGVPGCGNGWRSCAAAIRSSTPCAVAAFSRESSCARRTAPASLRPPGCAGGSRPRRRPGGS